MAETMRRLRLSIHDLTRRSTEKAWTCTLSLCSFNSRPHTEVDPDTRRLIGGDKSSFNSRPHTEVDVFNTVSICSIVLSIHDLTRRSTRRIIQRHTMSLLSIHDLTRRSTQPLSHRTWPHLFFQFTTSHGGRP